MTRKSAGNPASNQRGVTRPLAERIADADLRCNSWLADGNAAAEAGDHATADACYAKSQYWLDRLNLLRGAAEKAAPKR